MRYLAVLLVLFLYLGNYARPNNPPIVTDTVFNVEKFLNSLDDLIDQIDDGAIGLSVTVNKDGVEFYSRSEGVTIHSTDNNSQQPAFTKNSRHDVASLSKFVTTIMMANLLEQQNIDWGDPILDYLPPSWVDGAGTDIHSDHIDPDSPCHITFEKLLRHETCIQWPGNNAGSVISTDSIFSVMQLPAGVSDVYRNGSFMLARVLMAEIIAGFQLDETDDSYNDLTVDIYYALLDSYVYGPLGIDAPNTVNQLDFYTDTALMRAYQYPLDVTQTTLNENSNGCPGTLGWQASSSWYFGAGASNLKLSSSEFAQILAAFMHGTGAEIISNAQRDYIMDNRLGLSNGEANGGEGLGGWVYRKGGTRGPGCTGRAYKSIMGIYPNGMELVFMTNCNITNSLRSAVVGTWRDGWVRDCSVFRHVSREISISSNYTVMDNVRVNGDPEKLLFITEELTSQLSDSPLGVWYTSNGHWSIFNQDTGETMAPGRTFNVMALDADDPRAFKHTATLNNLTGAGLSRTIISHPSLNNNPEAHLIITQNWQQAPGVYNAHPVGVYFDSNSGYWQIYNTDGESISEGATFNIYMDLYEKHNHIAESPIAFYSILNDSDFGLPVNDLNETDMIFVTQKKSTIIDNSSELGLAQSNGDWWIVNKNGSNIVMDSEFNMLRFEDCECCSDSNGPIFTESIENDTTDQCLSDFTWSVEAFDRCGGPVSIDSVGPIIFTNGDLRARFSYTATDQYGNTTSDSKYIYYQDNVAPVILGIPENQIVQCSMPPIPDVTATDNCDDVLDWEYDQVIEGTDCDYKITRTWTATDQAENSTIASYCIYSGSYADMDEDGFDVLIDCDDTDPSVYPGATEFCDSVDNDCNELIDDECIHCLTDQTPPVDLSKSFNPVNGVVDRVQVKWYKESPRVKYTDEDAVMCDIKSWPVRHLDPETGQGLGPPIQNPDTISLVNRKKTYPDGSPRSIFKWPLFFKADGANNTKRVEPNTRYKFKVRCECGHDGNGWESPWSGEKFFNTPDFDPSSGVYAGSIDLEWETKSLEDELEISVYPNPTDGQVQISGLSHTEAPVNIQLIDMQGKVVFSKSYRAAEGRLSLELESQVTTRNYLIRIISESQIYTERLIVR